MVCCRLRRFWATGPVLLANVMVFWTPSVLIRVRFFSDGSGTLRTGAGSVVFSDESSSGMRLAC